MALCSSLRHVFALLLFTLQAVTGYFGDTISSESANGYISRDASAPRSARAPTTRRKTTRISSGTYISNSTKSNSFKETEAAEIHVPEAEGFGRDVYDASSGPTESIIHVELFPKWTTSAAQDPVSVRRVYLYSAFLSLHGLPPNGSDVDLVGIQDAGLNLKLTCCAILADHSMHQGSAAVARYSFPPGRGNGRTQKAVVYRCHFPFTAQQLDASHVTLSAAASCPVRENRYAAVLTPERVPGGLGLCAKAAYGKNLNPEKLLEWFEVQRLLGVDKIVIYDLNNTDVVLRIFRRHEKSGLLDLMPLILPGGSGKLAGRQSPKSRSDDTFAHLDCYQRLAGYDYVLAVDTDEIIMPTNARILKPLLRDNFKKHSSVASLTFLVQFFVDGWDPVDPAAPLLFLQFMRSTQPISDSHKYAYVPSRVHQLQTHKLTPASGFKGTVYLPSEEATVFHYRHRPDNDWWKKKSAIRSMKIDGTMLKFKDELIPMVYEARQDVGL